MSSASGTVSVAILKEAADIVGGARQTTHGEKERSFAVIAALWNAYLQGRKAPQAALSPRDVAQLMVLLKIGRSIQGTPSRDHFLDAAGYSAIAGEIADSETNAPLGDVGLVAQLSPRPGESLDQAAKRVAAERLAQRAAQASFYPRQG